MSIKPKKRIAAGAAGLAIAAAMFAPGAANAACVIVPPTSEDDAPVSVCGVPQTSEEEGGMFGSIPIIGPLLDSLLGSLGA
jgi:hypothetical protein